MAEAAIISPTDVYRALPPKLARDLHAFCKIEKDDPAAVIADALALHLDELGGEVAHESALLEPIETPRAEAVT